MLLKEINDWTFEVYFHPVLDSRWLSHWKWLVRDPMRGSWIFCQTEVWIVFCGLMSWPNAQKQLWPAQISKIERVGSIMTGPNQKNDFQFWTAESWQNDQSKYQCISYIYGSENLCISSLGETRIIKFGPQVNLTQRVPLGTLPQVTSLPQSRVTFTNLFISSYRRGYLVSNLGCKTTP